MPNEIPDSDEESDYMPASRPADPPFAEVPEVDVADRALDINFDDFINQSQPSKDGSSPCEQTKRSTASTQKHLREALYNRQGSASSSYDGADDIHGSAGEPQLPAILPGQRKRAYSDIGDAHDQRGSSGIRTKRTKTYGASTRRLVSGQDLEDSFEPANMEQTALPSAFAARSSSQAPQEQDDEEDIVPRARNRPRRLISLLGDSVPNAGHVISTSNSSIGGHQSINLDFRGVGSGLNVHANPFGAISQASVEASMEHIMEERRADLSSTIPLSASPQQPSRGPISPLIDAGFPPQPAAQFSPSTDPSVLTFENRDEPEMLTSPIATTAGQLSTSVVATAPNDDFEAETVPSHTTGSTTSKERGRSSKGSKQPLVASTRAVVTDLHDEDEFATCLPKEQYKPRPSKSRDNTIEPEHQDQDVEDERPAKKKGRTKSDKSAQKATEHSSPAKLPTSELNLSDEAVIGLPKEKYQPRPSRRRSRALVEEPEATTVFHSERIASQDTLDRSRLSQQSKHSERSQPVEVKQAPTPKPKKGRKTKVKRAKTSAAGLLKKSEPMISEGEEDVVWMETKPAKVKLDVPPNVLDIVKEENAAADAPTPDPSRASQQSHGDRAKIAEPVAAPQKTISVEIPARAEKEAVEPTKRGRKPKKPSEIVRNEEPAPETPESPSTSTPALRPLASSPPHPAIVSTALKEKDSNTCLPPPTPKKQTESSSPSRPARTTHSPIKPNGNKVLYRVGLSRKTAIPPLLKIVKPPAKQQAEKENFDEEGQPVDLVAETMRKWREMGVLD